MLIFLDASQTACRFSLQDSFHMSRLLIEIFSSLSHPLCAKWKPWGCLQRGWESVDCIHSLLFSCLHNEEHIDLLLCYSLRHCYSRWHFHACISPLLFFLPVFLWEHKLHLMLLWADCQMDVRVLLEFSTGNDSPPLGEPKYSFLHISCQAKTSG